MHGWTPHHVLHSAGRKTRIAVTNAGCVQKHHHGNTGIINNPLPQSHTVDMTSQSSTFTLLRSALQVTLLIVLFWASIGFIGALANYSDGLRRGGPTPYVEILMYWWQGSFPLALMTGLGYAVFHRWPQITGRPRNIFAAFVVMSLVLFPLEQIYQAVMLLLEADKPLSAASVFSQLRLMPKYYWFTDFVLMACTFLALLMIAYARQRRLRDLALQQVETDNLKLRLALEQQRMNSLRAQLEPHFLFNALNAIAALMRAADLSTSLTALQRLSELLRYAISAGQREWVSVADEVRFIDDYLALQKLRYGARLQVRFEGLDDSLDTVDCPPLLLQPLVENALRHDLDGHDGNSDILLQFSLNSSHLNVTISNPLNSQQPLNPGFGLGLRNIRERLQVLYGKEAEFSTATEHGSFVVRLRVPRYGRN